MVVVPPENQQGHNPAAGLFHQAKEQSCGGVGVVSSSVKSSGGGGGEESVGADQRRRRRGSADGGVEEESNQQHNRYTAETEAKKVPGIRKKIIKSRRGCLFGRMGPTKVRKDFSVGTALTLLCLFNLDSAG